MDDREHVQKVAKAITQFILKHNLPFTVVPELQDLVEMGFDAGSRVALETAEEVFGVKTPDDPKLNN